MSCALRQEGDSAVEISLNAEVTRDFVGEERHLPRQFFERPRSWIPRKVEGLPKEVFGGTNSVEQCEG